MSQLDAYISKLLGDDKALQEFLVDPLKAAEDENNLTKAQRSVLRRVVSNLSTSATNGYGVVRSLDSYRRSIRLLQNVLHLEKGSTFHHENLLSSDAASNLSVTYNIYVYYNGKPNEPDSTTAYQYYMLFKASVASSDLQTITLQEIMNNAKDDYGNNLSDLYESQQINGHEVVTSFTVPTPYNAPGYYQAAPQDAATSRAPFWYFTQGGRALTNLNGYLYKNGSAYAGGPGNTFATYTPGTEDPSDFTIFWQCIAPDVAYGFQSCKPSNMENVFGK